MPRGASEGRWEQQQARFDIASEPNEGFRFGWVVEIDPYDAHSTPRKRTALGRMRHEAATTTLTRDGRAAVYTGDDERFDYMYKFVSSQRVNLTNRSENMTVLDDGVLYVARFSDDGGGEWLPLAYGEGPLTPANGFSSQADVLIQTRRAADLIGATPMDRPEDIEANPVNGKVYAVMTNNNQRTMERVNGPNPRADNRHGHIVELTEQDNDAGAMAFTWEIFLLCGNPQASTDGFYGAGADPGSCSAISCPDNIAFDSAGNLWISTDGQDGTFKMNDGIYMVPTDGPERGRVQQFLSGVTGGECASLAITPDDSTLFVSIQHPGEGGSYAAPTSLWPDGHTPPRPGVIAVVAADS
jgi:secreted PhoX family phosphatase